MILDPKGSQQNYTIDRSELFQLYKIAIDEYHFQVHLNWQRSQYYFVLNAALIAAGGSLLGIQGDRARPLAALLFGVGLVTVALSWLVTITQHNYYRATRENLKNLETRLGIAEVGIRTTPAQGSRRRRLATVQTFNKVMFALLGLIDLGGIAYTWRSLLRAIAYAFSTWF